MLENEQIGGFTLNYKFYSGKDLYSDGEVEDEMLQICKEGDVDRVLQQGNSWPILYHLSNARENLLEWYEFNPNASLLEIGSGCGALTGLFSRKLASVKCIELSRKRSLINANKNGGQGSAEIFVGNFQDIELNEKFDYVTLIGVLEYSKLYISSERPFHSMLNKIGEYLKPGGKVIIAIENKMGMKYFAGAAEDHTGQPFDGIDGYVKGGSAETFSKMGLERLLKECNYSKCDFYYPMPDYKLPYIIFSDDYLPSVGDLAGMNKAYSGNNYELFSEERAYDTVCQDGLFPYFANSFLVIAEK